ncbi:MAG TPA: hypothetical protein VIK57_15275 [Streptosporangiaceae bacterium]
MRSVLVATHPARCSRAGTASGRLQTVSVIDTAAALAHRPALTGSIPAGLFPRDISYDPATGQVLVANYNSRDIELFRAPTAP